MTRSSFRFVVLLIGLVAAGIPNVMAAPKQPLVTKPSVEEALFGLPYVEVSEVRTLPPKEQDAFTTIILVSRAKYKQGFEKLPRKYLNVPDSATVILEQRKAWVATHDEQLQRFSLEAIDLRRDFGLISSSQAAVMKKVVREGEVSKVPVMIAAAATTPPGARPPPPPPAPKCGGTTAPPGKNTTYVCVCAGTPNATWELAAQDIFSVNPCTNQQYVMTQIVNEWVSQMSGGKCYPLYKSEKSTYSKIVKADPLNCRASSGTPTSVPATCGINQTTTIIAHSNSNCPARSKSGFKDVRSNSVTTVTAIPPTCDNPQWSYTKKDDTWTSTYNCDLTCTGCRNDEVQGP